MKFSLGSLRKELGTDNGNKLFIEYFMMLTAKCDKLNKIVEYGNENGYINVDKLKEILRGDFDDKKESFHT